MDGVPRRSGLRVDVVHSIQIGGWLDTWIPDETQCKVLKDIYADDDYV